MALIELHFPVLGGELPADTGFALYGALSRIVPRIHAADFPLRIAPIGGNYVGNCKIRLESRGGRLRIRVRTDDLPTLLPLAGKSLDLDGHVVRLGVPNVCALTPAPNLFARLVIIKASSRRQDPYDKQSRDRGATKRYLEPAAFLEAVRRELTHREIGAIADLPVHESGVRVGEPRRRVLRVHGKRIIGYSVLVQGLTAEESIRLQEEGLGGRGKMGCGFFVPIKQR